MHGLTIDGLGLGDNGVFFDSERESLAVTNCTIRHFRNAGIAITAGGPMKFLISNTLLSDNESGGLAVLVLGPPGGGPVIVSGTIDHVAAFDNGSGISVYDSDPAGFVNVTIVDSIASNNNDGIDVVDATVTILNSVMANNQDGFYGTVSASHRPTAVTVQNSSATLNNGQGFSAFGTLLLSRSVANTNFVGVRIWTSNRVYSYGDNDINGNITDVVGTLTPLATR